MLGLKYILYTITLEVKQSTEFFFLKKKSKGKIKQTDGRTP